MSPARVRYEPVGKNITPASNLKVGTNDEDENSEDQLQGSAAKANGGSKVDTASSGRKKNIAKTLFKTLPTPGKSFQLGRDDSAGMSFFIESPKSFLSAPNHCLGCTITLTSADYVIETLQNHSDSDDSIQPSRHVRRSSGFLSAQKKKEKPTSGLDGADSSDGFPVQHTHITPSKKTGQPRGQKSREPQVITLDSDSEPEIYQPQPTRSRRSGDSTKKAAEAIRRKDNMVPQSTKQLNHVEMSEDEIQLPVLTKGKGKQTSKPKHKQKAPGRTHQSNRPAFIEIESEVEDADPIISSPKRSQRPLHKPAETSSDEEDIRSSPIKRRLRRTVYDDDEDDEEPAVSPLKRSRQVLESEDSEDIVASPMKRRRPATRQDSDSEDLPSLSEISRRQRKEKCKERARSPSEPVETPMRTRQARARRHRTAKEKTMELLKRRRAGENIEELTESESDEEEEDDFQKLDEFDDEEESPEQPKKSSKSKVRRQRGDSSDEEAGESDFVIEDNDGPLGVPDYASLMPLEFTQAAHKPLKEHFRDVVEWMVQNKLNPGFTWNDPVYNQAFQKLLEILIPIKVSRILTIISRDNEYLGFADSKFVSTQWTAEFNRAVYARPRILITKLAPGEGIDVLGEAKCEPCNHRNHHPSFAIQFTGKAYHKATLEEIESESEDEDDDDDSDKASVNSKGQALPPTDKIWMSGRYASHL